MSTHKTPISVREQLEVALHVADEASYEKLDIQQLQRADWTISHVKQGDVRTTTRGHAENVCSGQVMIHPPAVPFSEYAQGAGTHQWIAIEARIWPNRDLLERFPVPLVVTLRDAKFYSDTFQQLLQAWHCAPASVRDFRVTSLALELLCEIIESWQESGAPPRPAQYSADNRFSEILGFMNENLARRISREELARKVHLHPVSFDRAFRAHYGIAPMQMLRDMRLRHAQNLLESTSDTLENIAQQCGLGDAAYFSRAFRIRFQQSPGDYRKRLKSTKSSYIVS